MAGKLYLLFLFLIILSIFASAHNPLPNQDKEKFYDVGRKAKGMVEVNKNTQKGNINPNSMKPNKPGVGMYTVSLPDIDGGFHVELGPIGFALGVGFGRRPSDVSPYGQPYLVVSPYSQPYVQPTQYPYVAPNQQPGGSVQSQGSNTEASYPPSPSISNRPVVSQGDNAEASYSPKTNTRN